MAIDHLLPGDTPAFLITAALCLAAAAFLFARLIPRVANRSDGTDRAALVGLACSALSIVPGIGLLWLGFPIVVAGAGVALGLLGRDGKHRRLALFAVVLGVVGLAGGFALELGAELADSD